MYTRRSRDWGITGSYDAPHHATIVMEESPPLDSAEPVADPQEPVPAEGCCWPRPAIDINILLGYLTVCVRR